tara:strand:+ start:275 stop:820 length:546 start_codon:yes stop_codon:yes gene_type:complete
MVETRASKKRAAQNVKLKKEVKKLKKSVKHHKTLLRKKASAYKGHGYRTATGLAKYHACAARAGCIKGKAAKGKATQSWAYRVAHKRSHPRLSKTGHGKALKAIKKAGINVKKKTGTKKGMPRKTARKAYMKSKHSPFTVKGKLKKHVNKYLKRDGHWVNHQHIKQTRKEINRSKKMWIKK